MIAASTIINQAIRRLSELSTTAPIHWTRSEILGWLNDAVVELNLITGELQGAEDVVLVDTENIFPLSSSAIAPLSCSVGGKFLQRESIRDLDSESTWEASDQTASAPVIFCPFGLTQILFHKRSSVTASVVVLEKPDPLTDAIVAIPFQDQYAEALEDFCVSRAMFKEGGAEFQQAVAAYNRFLDTAQQLSGRNVLKKYPVWEVYAGRTGRVTPRFGHEGSPKQ